MSLLLQQVAFDCGNISYILSTQTLLLSWISLYQVVTVHVAVMYDIRMTLVCTNHCCTVLPMLNVQ